MSTFMSIQDFSERTGISKSALRYYESRNLLRSVGRDDSGYRVYSDEQVPLVKFISSLRLADVPIKDIQSYLSANDENARKKMMEDWIQMIKNRLDVLQVSLQYLESDSINEQIYLIEKDQETIIWFSAESETGKFGEHFIKRGKQLEKLKIPIRSCYLKYLSGKDLIQAHIGFGVPLDIPTSPISEMESKENMAACLCIAMSFNEPLSEIQKGYQKLLHYANEHRWIPTSSILEWYRGEGYTQLDLVLPVTQMGKREAMVHE